VTTTLMQLRRLTRSRLGVPITDDFFSDAILDDNVNLAVQAIEAEYRWPWAERVDPVIVTAGRRQHRRATPRRRLPGVDHPDAPGCAAHDSADAGARPARGVDLTGG
jgi:hypothetical protein